MGIACFSFFFGGNARKFMWSLLISFFSFKGATLPAGKTNFENHCNTPLCGRSKQRILQIWFYFGDESLFIIYY